MPDDDDLYDLAEIFKVLAIRREQKILYVLLRRRCVCDIAQLFEYDTVGYFTSARILKQSKACEEQERGKAVLFLADGHMRSIIDQGYEHIKE